MKLRLPAIAILAAALLAACSPQLAQPTANGVGGANSTPAEPRELTVMTHDSFAVSEELVAAFEAEHNATLIFLKSGDTGEAVNKAVLAADQPLADVFYGVDNSFLSRALEGGIFEAYESPLLEQIPD